MKKTELGKQRLYLLWVLTLIGLWGCGNNTQKESVGASSREKLDWLILSPRIVSPDTDSIRIYTAMGIRDGLIIALGNEEALRDQYIVGQILETRNPIYPGFIDAHCHFWGLAETQMQVQLTGCRSWSEVISRCRDYAQEHQGLTRITGRGWDETLWPEGDTSSLTELSQAFPDIPVFIRRVDGHAALVNQKALELGGITQQSSIAGGKIVLHRGLLIDNAMTPIREKIPQMGIQQMAVGLSKASEQCLQWGITTVADAGLPPHQIAILDSMQQAGHIPQRIYAMLSYSPQNLEYAQQKGPQKTDFLRVHSFKFFADGALGSQGAKLKEPYCGKEVHRGLLLMEPQALKGALEEVSQLGFQAHTHCIGDSANRMVLDLYHTVLQGQTDRRWRIEHAQVLDTADMRLFNNPNIIPSIQPIHAISDMGWAEKRLCSHRMPGAYAYASLLHHAKTVAIGTDFPVEDPSTIANFYAAIARKNTEHKPREGFLQDQKLSRSDALRGMTLWAAHSLFMEPLIGSFQVGKKADFIELSQDLLLSSEESIPQTQVLKVFIDGKPMN